MSLKELFGSGFVQHSGIGSLMELSGSGSVQRSGNVSSMELAGFATVVLAKSLKAELADHFGNSQRVMVDCFAQRMEVIDNYHCESRKATGKLHQPVRFEDDL